MSICFYKTVSFSSCPSLQCKKKQQQQHTLLILNLKLTWQYKTKYDKYNALILQGP